MSELLAEVDEAMKRERLENIWKNYGNYFITLILLIIFGTGGYSAYSNWQAGVTQTQTDALIAAEAKNDPQALVDVAANLNGGLKAIAQLRAAGGFLNAKQEDKALELYSVLAADKNQPKEFQDLAIFMKARLEAKTNPDQALSALEALTKDDKSAYRFHARLESAMIFAHQKQDYKSASAQLAPLLTEQNMPQNLNAKANALSVLYGLKQIEK